MNINLWIIVSMVVGMIFIVLERRRRPKSTMKLPPGPPKLPIIGNLHQNLRQIGGGAELIYVTLFKMSQKYGGIMTTWLGMKPTIIISDHEGAWEVLVNKSADCASRMIPYLSKYVTANRTTLFSTDHGPYWQSLRKGVQGYAMNPSAISTQTLSQENEAIAMTQTIQEQAMINGGIIRPLVYIRHNTIRVVGRLCFGPDFNNKAFVIGIDPLINDVINLTAFSRFSEVFPFIRYIPGLRGSFRKAIEIRDRVMSMIQPEISRYQSSKSPCTTCYLHFLLSHDYPMETIIFCLFEIFFLSVDSTSSTIAWALAFLIRNPEIQKKLFKEVSGGDKKRERVTVYQVNKMPYLQAVVNEVFRMKPIAPLGIPHKTVKDTTLKGWKIDKGTAVMVNIYAIHHDPKVWDHPEQFMPERFLNENARNVSVATERSFLPFGAGMRICAGMDLGKLQVGLTLANLINKFEWVAADGDGPDMTDAYTALLRMKEPLVAGIKLRTNLGTTLS
ncbi:(S)-canadine synthase CYP719A21-like [Magnolia sinica]|uniref:(S)-canadine synthase CYP719A21-like n=1 Tax=Magnolia sinica TaxID=86752 RepID=UPI002658A4BB|nr:(S)-canadine synthase CYP719A21-like [Magnolia sinica]